tara:strand:- start:330 stop:443 length:114 start_codon:yes stop_codon:yes gene_type:complete
MPNYYELEDFEIKNKNVFFTTFCIGTTMFLGYIYYII